MVQTCIVHLIRNSLDYVSWKDRKAILPPLKPIYTAPRARGRCSGSRSSRPNGARSYPTIVQSWRRAWEHVIPFFAFRPAIRKIIYTTNAIESLNRSCARSSRPAATSPTTRRPRNCCGSPSKMPGVHWRRAIEWTNAMGQFAIQFGERFPASAN